MKTVILGTAARGLIKPGTAWIAVLALSPVVLTLLAGPLASTKISTNFMIPVFFMVPLAVLVLSEVAVSAAHLKTIARGALLYPLAAILLSPAIAYV